MPYSSLAVCIIISYFLGSISTGWIVYQMSSNLQNPREIGSGSYGATNMLRLGSKKTAIITLLGDAFKGIIAITLALVIVPFIGQTTPIYHINFPIDLVTLCAIAAALSAMIGHCFPFYSPVSGGGKGVATFFGIWLALFPLGGIGFVFVWITVAKIWKYSSLAALIAMLSAPLVAGTGWILNINELTTVNTAGIAGVIPWPWLTLTAILADILVWGRHHRNIVRLVTRKEPKIGKTKAS